jgi:hypothetical protein
MEELTNQCGKGVGNLRKGSHAFKILVKLDAPQLKLVSAEMAKFAKKPESYE